MQKIKSTRLGQLRLLWAAFVVTCGLVGFSIALPILFRVQFQGLVQVFSFCMLVIGGTGGAVSLLILVRRQKAVAINMRYWELIKLRGPQESMLATCRTWAQFVLFFWLIAAIGIIVFLLVSPNVACC